MVSLPGCCLPCEISIGGARRQSQLGVGVNAHRKQEHVIVENESTLVDGQFALLLSSL